VTVVFEAEISREGQEKGSDSCHPLLLGAPDFKEKIAEVNSREISKRTLRFTELVFYWQVGK
jgi:hypothetical protein